jgi:hypothetical protein
MGNHQLEEGHSPARFALPRGIIINIKSAIYAPKATCNRLNFKDIRDNGFHIQTSTSGPNKVLNLTTKQDGDTVIKRKNAGLLTGI